MNCIKAQSMITPFIDNKLTLKETEEFLDHMSSCQKCREELEFYYVLLTAMKQLDEDKDLSNDFSMELTGKMKRAQDKIVHAKFTYYRKTMILIFIMFFVAILLGIRYSVESDLNTTNVTKSDFQIKNTFHDMRYDELSRRLEEYLIQQRNAKALNPLQGGDWR